MIRNLEKIDYVQSLKTTIMHSISRILKSQPSNSILFVFLRMFLTAIASCSVLFINSPLQPKMSNQIFRILVLSHVSDLLASNQHIFLITLVVFQTIVSILIIINFLNTPISYVVKALCFVMPLMRALIVPFFYFLLQNIDKIFASGNMDISFVILRLLLIFSSAFVITFTCFYTYFFIRPLRFQNIQWNYTNNQSFVHLIFTLVRALYIFLETENILMLFLSLIAEIQIFRMQTSWLCPQNQLLQKAKHILCILINFSVILGAIFSNKSLSFVLLIVSFILYLTFLGIKFMAMRQQIEEIPLCKKQNCSLFYAFFIDFKSRNRNVGEDLAKKVNFHLLICDHQECIFKDGAQFSTFKISAEEMEQKITKFLKQFRYDSPEFQLMYEIWKIQMNRTISLSHKLRPFSLKHQYVVQFILGMQSSNKAENGVNNSIMSSSPSQQSNSLSSKWNFYKQLSIAVNQFEKMTEILSKPLPQLNHIIDTVIGIDNETIALTQIFQEMIKNKQANYVCIELYLKYFDVFFNENKLSSDIIEKLKRLRILVDSDFIEENPLPSFIIDSTSTAIQKVNAQALKFLRIHRFELKDKLLSSFVVPKFDPKQVYQIQLKSQKQQKFPIFFRIKSSQKVRMYCRNIILKPLQLNNKNYFEITVQKKSNSHNIIQFVIDQQENIIASTSEKVILVFQQGKMQFDFLQIYSQKIKPILNQISFQKIGRIDFDEFCQVSGMVSQKNCPYHSKMRLFSLNLVKKMIVTRNTKRTSQARLSKLFNLHSQFNFYYKFDQDQEVILQGSLNSSRTDDEQFDENLSMRTLNEKLTNYIIEVTGNSQINYCQGIKVYRLYQGDLYNIDLEDRQKYQQQFNNIQIQLNFQSSKSCGFKMNSKVLVAFLIGLTALVIACSLFVNVVVGNGLNFVEGQQIKLLHIQEFSLNYNRIMASLRDRATRLYDKLGGDYKINVLDSYAELQKYDSSNFLSQTVQQGVYAGQIYQGSLSELIEVSLTHVYEFMQLQDDPIIEHIHDFSLKYLGPLLSAQKQQKKLAIQNSFKSVLNYSLLCFILIVGGSIGYFIFFILVSQQYKKRLNNFIEPLLLISEHDNKRVSEQCEKFKNTISSLYKNYEIDLDTIGQKSQGSKKRERPKRTNFGICSLLCQFVVGGLTVVIIIGVVSLHYSTIIVQSSVIRKFFKQSQAIMESYSGLNWATNQFEHLGIVNLPEIYNLSSQLDIIQFNKDSYQFSPELTEVVRTVFFEDSCEFLINKNILDQQWCGDFMKSFDLTNPLKLGLSLYFRRLNYNLISDIAQTYGSNGIYSEPFKQIFQYFSQKILKQTEQKMILIKSKLLALATIVSILSFWLIAIFVISYAYFKNKIKNVSKGLISLIGEQQANKEKEVQHDKNGNEEAEWSIGEKIEQEDFLIPAKQGLDEVCQQ